MLPIALLIAIAIPLNDRGAIFFRQQRTGLGGRRFTMLKFRTMCTNAEEMKAELQHLSLVAYPDFKMENDPRITKVGRFLRATFLDELPQLINVIRGDMSLVGPRPTSFAASTYSLWHTERLEAKPGITGLWQVRRGADETCLDERLRLDVGVSADPQHDRRPEAALRDDRKHDPPGGEVAAPPVPISGRRLLVLGWHNVEGTPCFPSAPGTGIGGFCDQLDWLERWANVVPLGESLRRLSERRAACRRARWR